MTTLATALQKSLDGRWAAIREQARTDLDPERFAPPTEPLDLESYRARIADQVQALAETGHAERGFPTSMGGNGDLGGSVTAFELLGHADLSLMVKAGVHWGLFGGAVAKKRLEDTEARLAATSQYFSEKG